MVIKFSDTAKISISDGTIWDYPMPEKDIGISYQKLTGRGPTKGCYLNQICHEIYFIISGAGTFHFRDKSYRVKKQDVVVVEPKTAHYIETNNLEYITITRPDWYEEQYEEIDK